MKSTSHRMNLDCVKSIVKWFVICFFDKSVVVNFWNDDLILVAFNGLFTRYIDDIFVSNNYQYKAMDFCKCLHPRHSHVILQ